MDKAVHLVKDETVHLHLDYWQKTKEQDQPVVCEEFVFIILLGNLRIGIYLQFP